MSHPIPTHDYDEPVPRPKADPKYIKDARKKNMAKKMSKVDKLKKLVKESENLRKHPFKHENPQAREDEATRQHYWQEQQERNREHGD